LTVVALYARGEITPPNKLLGCPSCGELIDTSGAVSGKVTCPSCQKKFKVTQTETPSTASPAVLAASCTTDGRPQYAIGQLHEPSTEGAAGKVPLHTECPFCGAVQTARVEAVYEEGTYLKSSSSLGAAIVGDDLVPVVSGSKGQQQSLLASRLAPPPAPRRNLSVGGVVVVGLLTVAAVGVVVSETRSETVFFRRLRRFLGDFVGESMANRERTAFHPQVGVDSKVRRVATTVVLSPVRKDVCSGSIRYRLVLQRYFLGH
jgi:hypothetical protein